MNTEEKRLLLLNIAHILIFVNRSDRQSKYYPASGCTFGMQIG